MKKQNLTVISTIKNSVKISAAVSILSLAACANIPKNNVTQADTVKNTVKSSEPPKYISNIIPVSVQAVAETAPVNSVGDAADDPAIWYNEKSPKDSKIIGTQKKGGIYVYNLDGTISQEIMGGKPNNVDLRTGFNFSGEKNTIVGASDRTDNTITLWKFNDANATLGTNVIARIPTGFPEVYGFCIGKFGNDFIAVATSKVGDVRGYKIKHENGQIVSEKFLDKSLGSISEGCVIDDETGRLFVSQELVGLWAFNLKTSEQKLIDTVKTGNLAEDVEGVTLWKKDNKGYIIVSVQGESRFNVYNLNDYKYRGSFNIIDGVVDGVTNTDGIDISSYNFGEKYPDGLIVTQDDINTMPDATQNFKMISWKAIADKLGL